jgi:hypothetical protein
MASLNPKMSINCVMLSGVEAFQIQYKHQTFELDVRLSVKD